jgi:hypothetical protein
VTDLAEHKIEAVQLILGDDLAYRARDSSANIALASRIASVISAKKRSESVSPITMARLAPSLASIRPRSPTTPLWANSRPSWLKGCVFTSETPPVLA